MHGLLGAGGKAGLPGQGGVPHMEHGAAGEHRQGLVQAVTAEIRPQLHGVPGAVGEEQLRPVGIVHQQRHTVPAADL